MEQADSDKIGEKIQSGSYTQTYSLVSIRTALS